ncbi:mediator complex subunit MED7 [Aspergillus puulaauensis]|uniref:Mediator of RNA polymerase II transcription subunit 7 n=1 Tax=Aspergillus puulaauensis TaxID=1220207 RepID=A0A7R7XFI8_9EURO|nr:mediator of RNA polymerase II transcription subunit 7 [Aspergillus puulaauensis]BCS20495.1 mediator of RNA polymerase II transcription subunit 7 [Aspergillus puulaauensis]
MAEAGRAINTAFAPPPPLWKHFTPENLQKLQRIKKEASKGEDGKPQKKDWSAKELRSLTLPPELRFLVPPEIPSEQYSVFGEVQSLSTALPPLEDQGITQLYPSSPKPGADGEPASQPEQPLNHAYYLLKISKSLLLNFLEFVGILSETPEQFEPKVEDIRNLFINAHHLLNLYRPHQARESLIMMMEEQLSHTKEEIQQMDKLKEELNAALDQLAAEGADVGSTIQPAIEDDEEAAKLNKQATEDSRLLWDIIDGKADS